MTLSENFFKIFSMSKQTFALWHNCRPSLIIIPCMDLTFFHFMWPDSRSFPMGMPAFKILLKTNKIQWRSRIGQLEQRIQIALACPGVEWTLLLLSPARRHLALLNNVLNVSWHFMVDDTNFIRCIEKRSMELLSTHAGGICDGGKKNWLYHCTEHLPWKVHF